MNCNTVRNIIIFLLLAFSLSSCVLSKFTPVSNEIYSGVDFSKGRWLLNSVDAHWRQKPSMDSEILARLKKIKPDSLYFINDVDLKYISNKNLQFNISKEVLELLDKTTDFDFIINTRARILKDDAGPIQLVPRYEEESSMAEFEIAIYDTKTQKRIYSLKMSGKVTIKPNNEKFLLSDSGSTLLHKCIKKGLNRLKKNSCLKQ